MNKFKSISIITLTVIVGIALTVILISPAIIGAVRIAAEGDQNLQFGKPTEALEKYKEAQKKWPPLKYNREFKGNVDKAKAEKDKIKEKVAVSIFLKSETSDTETQSLVEEIKSLSGVREVKFISQKEALDIYKERNQDDPLLLEFVTVDLLPTTIEVFLEDLSIKSEVANLAKSKSFVESVIETPDR